MPVPAPANFAYAARFSELGNDYFSAVAPTPLPEPRMVHLNHALAANLGLSVDTPTMQSALAGNAPFPRQSWGSPLSSVYAGHQFGVLVPRLGDGRAHLIAEIDTPLGPWELQLKGSGPTPYSRFADGRAVLRSSIREYLGSEAMAGLGIPTTRALSLIASPLPVRREILESAAVVCRAAPSFIRFGHFEYFYYQDRHDALMPLADHLIGHHFPALRELSDPYQRHRAWLEEVLRRTASMITAWQAVGFCHGVMNTDNFSALGLTIDYGPFGFMDGFDPNHICNHSDVEGRYAWNQQPTVGHWNCSRLLQATLPLLHPQTEEAVAIANQLLADYPAIHMHEMSQRWSAKLGLRESRPEDRELVSRLLDIMGRSSADFTRTFRRLAEIRTDVETPAHGPRDEIRDIAAYDAWVSDYRQRLRAENSDDPERATRMNAVNPCYVLRNHLAQHAIERAERGDDSEVEQLYRLLSTPFTEQPGMDRYAAEPPADQIPLEISCSS